MQILCGLQVVFFLFNCQTPGADRPSVFEYPNRIWGYGILDLYGGFQAISGKTD